MSAAILTAGCASQQKLTTLAPVGPGPGAFTGGNAPGHLMVYSATHAVSNGSNTMAYPHSDYKIYDRRNAFLRLVRNHISPTDEMPDRVDLPPGNYTVVAESDTRGEVAVPVIIEAARSTVVHLEEPARSIAGN